MSARARAASCALCSLLSALSRQQRRSSTACSRSCPARSSRSPMSRRRSIWACRGACRRRSVAGGLSARHRSRADAERGAARGAARAVAGGRSTHGSRASASASARRPSCRACSRRAASTKRCSGSTPPTICGSRRISTSGSLRRRSRPTKKSGRRAKAARQRLADERRRSLMPRGSRSCAAERTSRSFRSAGYSRTLRLRYVTRNTNISAALNPDGSRPARRCCGGRCRSQPQNAPSIAVVSTASHPCRLWPRPNTRL